MIENPAVFAAASLWHMACNFQGEKLNLISAMSLPKAGSSERQRRGEHMISLTGRAVEAVDRFITGANKPIVGLRIQVEGGGCSGFKYIMRLEESSAANDQQLDCGGVTVLIDENSASMLEGVTVDFVEGLEGSGFKFENPNATKACGCGKSFSC